MVEQLTNQLIEQVSYSMARAPRVEIITGVERRRRFTDGEKLAIIEETLAPGTSIATVADRHSLAPRLLYTWKSHLKRSGLLALPPPRTTAPAGGDGAFVRIDAVHHDEPQVIRVHLDEAIVVEFPASFEPGRLAAVVQALRA